MTKIILGSKNPVKIQATKEIFEQYFSDVEVIGIGSKSNVPDQPFDNETIQGARNRAQNLYESSLQADYYIGLEGGIGKSQGNWYLIGAAAIIDKEGVAGDGRTGSYPLPKKWVQEIKQGSELGKVIDKHTGKKEIRKTLGTVGVLTKGVIKRNRFFHPAIAAALIPILHKDLYHKKV